MESGVFEEQLGEQARVGSPFCCLPENITAVQNIPNNVGGARMPAAIACKTLDEIHAWVSYKITKKLSTTANG